MFSKEESKQLRQEFWTSFGKHFPKKWILYNTKIKGFSFKFHFDTKKAIVSLDIEDSDLENRIKFYEKLQSLQNILKEEYISDIIYDDIYYLENGKEISKIYVQLNDVCINNKATWSKTMEFFNEKMLKFEQFWYEYEDFIKN
ncbi:DUF4268 domain-containing protein [Abyssalbus ytuae]|uniref:DUF4268 domain-containing protein n=1 Tax=Abyssalbus ytuae TaxID=2926907 RepID=A0A9E7A054_9FLAO|nr:DUF4268 domain-containing protein [Abyssalbus ytuae]UOB17196.1 DUF4268 domain-containing protein [Abyssalbus ytuae]